MRRQPPTPTLTATLFPYTTRFRSRLPVRHQVHHAVARRAEVGIGRVGRGIGVLDLVAARGGGQHRVHAPAVPLVAQPQDRLEGRHRVQVLRSEAHTSELQSLMRISYAVFCLKKKNTIKTTN